MSQEIINKALQKTLISPLTSDSLWQDFLKANSYELANIQNKYAQIKNTWNIDKNDKDGLIRIAESFGYNPNLVIDNTIFMSKKEIESIPYRIREKTTYNGYKLIFQQNGFLGETFNYYWNNKKLIKSIDYNKTLNNLKNSDHYRPFYGVTSIKNFSSILNSSNVILDYLFNGSKQYDDDNLRIYSLDQKSFNPVWKLDKSYIKIPTHHLGIEYFPSIYYSSYKTTLGFGEDDKFEYTTSISVLLKDNYIAESIKIIINNISLNTTITNDGNKEYISDDEVLDSNSYYDKVSGEVYLKFKVIPIGYEISISYNIDIFVTSDYFYYLEQGMEYNRRCPIIPHTGVFLTADISQARGSDFYFPNDGDYTVHDLKLKAQTTSAYNRHILLSEESRLDNATDEYGNPNGKVNYKLDDVLKWYLDTSSSSLEDLSKNFKYIASGNRALPISNEQYSQIFNMATLLFAYNFNGDDDSTILRDASTNKLNCAIHGNPKKINGIIDKSLNFNGDTWAVSNGQLTVDSSKDYTFGVWFNPNKEPDTEIECIFDNFINISYDYKNEKIIIASTEFDCPKNKNYFLCMTINSNTSTLTTYLNGIQLGVLSFSMISTSSTVYIGVDSSLDYAFCGIIDNMWLVDKELTREDIKYINDNGITVISHMGNRLNYYELSDDEISDSNEYTLVQSYVRALDITNEVYNIVDDNSKTFTFQTNIHPILNPYFEIDYIDSFGKTINIKANEKGEFYNPKTNEIITGNIDFENGICVLNKDTIKSKSQQTIVRPTKTDYETAYRVIVDSPSSDTYYENYDYGTDTPSDPIIADEYVIDSATNVEKLSIYEANEDSNPKINVYENNDDERYYIKDNNNEGKFIKQFNVIGDNDETPIFSEDGKILYFRLNDLKTSQNQLKSFTDLGEATATILYSTDNGVTMFLDVDSAKKHLIDSNYHQNQIVKYTGLVNDILTNAYTLNNDSSTFYSNLSFTSTVSFSNVPHPSDPSFNPQEKSIKTTEVDLELTPIKTVYKYENIYTIDYLNGFTATFSDPSIAIIPIGTEIVKGSLTFDFWTDIEGKYSKVTATVADDGVISGKFINTQNSSFDYNTNTLHVEFLKKINSDVIVSFEYYYSLDIDITKPLIMNYKSEKSIMINEIGLEDENHELMAYMTFPNIGFHSIYNNISALFAINKE